MGNGETASSPRDRNNENMKDTRSFPLYKYILPVGLLAAFAAAYFPVWRGLVNAWSNSDEYSHGFFILPVCLYILWRKKETLRNIPVRPSLWGLGLAIFSLLVYMFAHFAGIVTAASLSMVPLAAGVVIFFYGFLMLREVMFPLFILLFMIPVPSQIYSYLTIPLQLFVTKVSVWTASSLGIPIYREGNIIFLPEHTLQVVRACSGLRSMISLLTLGALFGYFTLKSNFLRTVLFFTAIPASILVNIVRVMLMVMAFYYMDWNLAKGTVHTLFGLFIFAFALVLVVITRGVLSLWDGSKAGE